MIPQSRKYASIAWSRAGERAGVRARERVAEPRAPELVGDYRFPGGMRLARRCGKARRVAHRLEEEQDHARVPIVDEQLDQLADAEVGLVADRDQLGEAEAARRAAREHRAEHRAALRDDAGGAGGQRVHLQHRVHRERDAARDVDHAHAVRPEQADAERARTRDEARLARRAFRAGLGEAVGEDGDDGNAARAARLDGELHRVARRHDEGVVDRARGLGEVRVRAFAEDLRAARR